MPFSILEIFNIGICGIFFHDGEWGCGFGISGRGAGWEQPSGRSYCTVVFVTCDDLGICPLTVGFEGNRYHFAVRAQDIHLRVGGYSAPQSISLN